MNTFSNKDTAEKYNYYKHPPFTYILIHISIDSVMDFCRMDCPLFYGRMWCTGLQLLHHQVSHLPTHLHTVSRLGGKGFSPFDGSSVPKCSSHPCSIGPSLAMGSLAVSKRWQARCTRKAPRWIWLLITLLVGGRASIPALALVEFPAWGHQRSQQLYLTWPLLRHVPSTSLKEQKSVSSKDMAEARSMDIAKERGMNIRQVLTHDILSASPLFDDPLTPAQTCTKYFSASAVSWSDKVSASPKFVKYCTGSEAIAACFVPTLLMQSSPVRICALITVLASGAPRLETAWCRGSMRRFSPVPNCC